MITGTTGARRPARGRPRRGGTGRSRRRRGVPSGKMPTAPPSRSTRRQVFTARGSVWNRSSGICPDRRRNRPMRPSNISILVSACTGRGREDRQQRAVDHADVVGRRRSPGRSAGTRSAPWHAARRTGAGTAHARDGRSGERSRTAARVPGRGRCAAARVARAQAAHARRLRPPRRARPPGRSPRRGCTAVVSMWTAPSAMISGAVARPESIRSRASSDSRVASTSVPPGLGGPAHGAGARGRR